MDNAEILRQWLHRGKEEIESAEYLSTMRHPTPDETICYLCQQSAEKYLKAYIFLQEIEPEKTHDLEELLGVCNKYNEGFSILLTKVIFLTKYAVMPRYPNELQITSEDMKIAIRYAKDVQEFVLKIIDELQENAE